MNGKLLETVVCVLSIGVLQYFTVLGCQTNSDCLTQTTTKGSTKECCYKVDPPRCMDWLMCSWYQNDHTKQAPTFYPKYPVPDYNRATPPDYDRFTVPDYTLPEFSFNELTVTNIDIPTLTYSHDNNNDNNDYDGSTDSSSGLTPGGAIAIVVGIIFAIVLMIFFLSWVPHRPTPNHFVQPSAATTSQTNLVRQQNRELSRIVIIAVTRDEDQIDRQQNQPPDGEPPFLSEEDILHNLHNNCAQDPPPYDEATAGSHLPKYEDSLPPPAYAEVQATSDRSSLNPSLVTPTVEQNLHCLPIVIEPTSYEEARGAAYNEAVEPLP